MTKYRPMDIDPDDQITTVSSGHIYVRARENPDHVFVYRISKGLLVRQFGMEFDLIASKGGQ